MLGQRPSLLYRLEAIAFRLEAFVLIQALERPHHMVHPSVVLCSGSLACRSHSSVELLTITSYLNALCS